jgi:hypothetical protein
MSQAEFDRFSASYDEDPAKSLAVTGKARDIYAEMKDGIVALWYILRFNFLCSLENSFRTLPDAGSAQRAARRKGQ